MNDEDICFPSLPATSIKFSRVVIFICDPPLEGEANWFTVKQTRGVIYKISALSVLRTFTVQFLFSANFLYSFCLSLSQLFTPLCKMHTYGSYQLPINGIPSSRKENENKALGEARLLLIARN